MYRSVAVFCGSKSGNDPIYEQHAKELGSLFARHRITLIYGGGSRGLMGTVADAVLDQAGEVIGVIPEILSRQEHRHEGLTRLHIVEDMHVRKKLMYELCEAAIILPGGNGTLDELFEMITWNNLSIHDKKIILLNSAGYYNFLFGHIAHMQQQGFLYNDWMQKISVFDTPDAIFNAWAGDKCQNQPG